MENYKAIAKLCFDDFRDKAVLIMEHCDSKALAHLKKRNFVNVIKVDAPFKVRMKYYCEANKKQPVLETYEEFAKFDADYQTKDYQKCQEFVRVSIYNDGDYEKLEKEIL
jgi:hypothetical protein